MDAREVDCDPPQRSRDRRRNKRSRFCDNEDRRTTFVVMDAGDDARTRGEILAVVAWPGVEQGVPLWDLGALEIGAPGESPVSGEPWRANDATATPGSTFKLVTALAAIQAALDGDDTVRRLLEGGPDARWIADTLGVASGGKDWQSGRCKPEPGPINELNALPVVGVDGVSIALCIGNAGESRRGPLTAALMRPQTTGCGGKRRSTPYRAVRGAHHIVKHLFCWPRAVHRPRQSSSPR